MSQHSLRGPRWEAVRMQAKNRAGGMCENQCGRDGNEADHIVPLASGGEPYDLANIQWLCKTCNTRKGARTNKVVRKTWFSPYWFPNKQQMNNN